MANIQNRLHAEDPVANPRDARTAYQMEPRELFEVNRDGDRSGWSIVLFYHSHPSHGAYFSDTDRARALWGDPADGTEPAYPGVAYMVVSVYDREVRDVQVYPGWRGVSRSCIMYAPAGTFCGHLLESRSGLHAIVACRFPSLPVRCRRDPGRCDGL
jgi:proteasome lid subunit RPN8/RPN11